MSIRPIPPKAMPSDPRLDDPKKFYQVLQNPAPLAGMCFPRESPWASLAAVGFRSVVCLTRDTPPYDPTPLEILRSAKFKDLFGGLQPDDPKHEAAILKEIVQAIVSELRAGRGVSVHCEGGTGRTGTVIACTFRSLGMAGDEVLKYMESVNKIRTKYTNWKGWPESDWQRRQVMEWVSEDA